MSIQPRWTRAGFASILAALAWLSGREGRPAGSAASFSVSPPNPTVGQLVRFTNTSSPPGGSSVWNFGDGTPSVFEPNPTHAYLTARRYSVSFNNGASIAVAIVDVSPTDTLRLNAAHSFDVSLAARDQRTSRTGAGRAIPQNDLFGYFSIPDLTSNPDNPEVFVKLLDGRTVNGEYWVFYGGLTDLEYTLTVRENATGSRKIFLKEAGSAFGGFDTSGFRPTPPTPFPTPTRTPAVCPSQTPLPTVTPVAGPPLLTVPVIDLSTVTRFTPFGDSSIVGKVIPNWEIVTSDGALDVVAATAGRVTRLDFQTDTQDFEIETQAPGSLYLVIYDHVRNATVSVNQTVVPGQRLGRIGAGGPTGGRVELQINRADLRPYIALCPAFFGTDTFNAAHAQALRSTNTCLPLCVSDTALP